jgi:DNA-binding NarL/FixJ family response regulator
MRTSLLLVEDHTVVREGIRALLELEPGILVVGEAKDGRQAVAMTKTLDPDVVLMDIGMPNMNGIEATRQIRLSSPRSRVLILTAHSDDHYIEGATSMGAVGFILKQSSLADLAQAIRETGRGGTVVSPVVGRRFLEKVPGPRNGSASPSRRVPRLSSRETEVLQLISEGRANKETAATLGISIKTVEKHRQRLMGKLDIHDVAGLTRYAVTEGIVDAWPKGFSF